MVKKKIALIMPIAEKYRFNGNIFAYPYNLTLPVLYSLIPKDLNIKCEIFDESWDYVDYESIDADIVGISAITSTIKRAYQISEILRKRGIKVVIGGVHVTLNPKEVLKHCDSIVTGIASKSWPQLLRDYYSSNMQKHYKQEKNISFEKWPTVTDLCYKKDNKAYWIKSVQATFGCTQACSFCVQPYICNGFHKRPIQDVIKDIKECSLNIFEFLDPNISQDKEYLKKLCKELIPLNKVWTAPMTIDIAEDLKLLELLRNAGCRSILIGFESINQKSLATVNKKYNKVIEYKRCIDTIHKYGISIIGSFVFGLDNDDVSVFKNTIKYIRELKIDIPRFTINTPYKGTPLYNTYEKEKRLIDFDLNKYDADHVVFQPKHMTKEELENGYFYVWKKAYNLLSLLRRFLFIKTFRLKDFFGGFMIRKVFFKMIKKRNHDKKNE